MLKIITSINHHLMPLNIDDLSLYIKIYTDVDLMRYIGKPMSKTAAIKSFHQALKQAHSASPEYIMYSIENTKGEKVGIIGLIFKHNNSNEAEIGTIILKQFQKNKHCTESMRLLMKHAFDYLNINNIIGITQKNNKIVSDMNIKLGFKLINHYPEKHTNISKIRWEITHKRLINAEKRHFS